MVILQAAFAFALLFAGGELLVRGASAMAFRAGVSQLAIGLTVVAFGTSAPELVVSLDAALTGANDISVGNVVGSNVANIALILGIAAVIAPISVQRKAVRADIPFMLAASGALLAVLANGTIARLEGAVLATGLLGFVVFTMRQSRRELEASRDDSEPEIRIDVRGLGRSGVLVLVGLALLVGGGRMLVSSAVRFAEILGLSQAAIGLTIVAVGTSLPELATSLIASWRGHNDLAVGNVVGSNVFNILGIIGMTAVVHPLSLGSITWTDLLAMSLIAVALLPIAFTGRRIGRLEGAFLLLCYGVYIAHTLGA
jgi:cation:H+ antiporter